MVSFPEHEHTPKNEQQMPDKLKEAFDKWKETFPGVLIAAESLDEEKPWVLVRAERSGTWIGRMCCCEEGQVHLVEARRVLNELTAAEPDYIATAGWLTYEIKLGPETDVRLAGVYETQPITPDALEKLQTNKEWKQ